MFDVYSTIGSDKKAAKAIMGNFFILLHLVHKTYA